jgi:FkbM family methyltransferase
VEAGAAGGEDTAISAAFWPKCRIFAFEPVPHSYQRLAAAVAPYPNVSAIPMGLFNRSGETKMHLSNNGFGSSSILKPTGHLTFHPSVKFDEQITIRVTTLDLFAAEHGLSAVDFLWLDMQGAELAALKEGEQMLTTVCAIHMEVSLKPTYEHAPLYPEVRSWLKARGFSVANEALPYRDMGNVLFVNNANLRRRRDRPVKSGASAKL